MAQENKYMDVGQLAKYLHRSKSTIYRYNSNGIIPRTQISKNGKVLYEKGSIDAWLQLFYRKSEAEKSQDVINDMILKKKRK